MVNDLPMATNVYERNHKMRIRRNANNSGMQKSAVLDEANADQAERATKQTSNRESERATRSADTDCEGKRNAHGKHSGKRDRELFTKSAKGIPDQ